jgi:hypothetical protein
LLDGLLKEFGEKKGNDLFQKIKTKYEIQLKNGKKRQRTERRTRVGC